MSVSIVAIAVVVMFANIITVFFFRGCRELE